MEAAFPAPRQIELLTHSLREHLELAFFSGGEDSLDRVSRVSFSLKNQKHWTPEYLSCSLACSGGQTLLRCSKGMGGLWQRRSEQVFCRSGPSEGQRQGCNYPCHQVKVVCLCYLEGSAGHSNSKLVCGRSVDKAFVAFDLQPFYLDPQPHVSLAWLPGDHMQELRAAVDGMSCSGTEPSSNSCDTFPCHIPIHSVICMIGERIYTVWSASARV